MRTLRSLLLVLALWVLPLPLGGDRAVAIFTCGRFDGTFQCKATSGGVQHGKNASPNVGDTSTPEERPKAPANKRRPPLPGIQLKAPKVALGRLFSRASIPVPRYRVLAAPDASGSYCEPPAERKLPTRGASTEWSARRLVVTAQRTRSCWAATASITPLPAAMASPPTSPRNPAREPTKSSPVKCVRTA